MKRTVLRSKHAEYGARMGEFGGWEMPIQYAGILEEHAQTRTKASVFDICHMGEFELSGDTAERDLEHLLTCSVHSLEVGQVRYGFLLDDKGCTIDDLTCYRLDQNRFMLVVNAGTTEKDAAWIRERLSPATHFQDLSAVTAKLDIQGPQSRDVLEDVFGCTLPDLAYFRFKELEAVGAPCIISRTGYTGEWGYEIYLPIEAAVGLWDRLLTHECCQPAGLGARDTLRLEMGYPLYGHELSSDRTPVPTSGSSFIDVNKDFIGKDGVEVDLSGPQVKLVGLRFESRRAARAQDKVYSGDEEIGIVTSGSFAPSLGYAIAMAFVDTAYSETGRTVQVRIRNRLFPAEVVDLPFYKSGTARRLNRESPPSTPRPISK